MSYDIVKSISIKDDKVYITSASNNVHPRTFERWECTAFSKLYQEGGLEKLLPAIAADVWAGNFKLQNGSKICTALSDSYKRLYALYALRYFLDTERAAKYIAEFSLYLMDKGPEPDLGALADLRGDKAAVLDVCSKNPAAFNYAHEAICKDREAAKAHILANADKLSFYMPSYFQADKELAMLAIEKDGTIYRQLHPSVQEDPEITKAAFDASRNRPHFEHLPDLIPESLRKDKAFMADIVSVCPRIHMARVPELLNDKDIILAWLNTGAWSPYLLNNISSQVLKNPEVLNLIRAAEKNRPEVFQKAKEILDSRSISIGKPTLSSLINSAQNRTTKPEKMVSDVKNITR